MAGRLTPLPAMLPATDFVAPQGVTCGFRYKCQVSVSGNRTLDASLIPSDTRATVATTVERACSRTNVEDAHRTQKPSRRASNGPVATFRRWQLRSAVYLPSILPSSAHASPWQALLSGQQPGGTSEPEEEQTKLFPHSSSLRGRTAQVSCVPRCQVEKPLDLCGNGSGMFLLCVASRGQRGGTYRFSVWTGRSPQPVQTHYKAAMRAVADEAKLKPNLNVGFSEHFEYCECFELVLE